MSRREVKRTSGSRFIKGQRITPTLLEFFKRTAHFTGADILIDQGISATFNNPELSQLAKNIPEVDRYVTESLFVSLIDNFQTYLSEMLVSIFSRRPEVLSGGSIKNSTIFEAGSLDDLKRYVIDRAVLDLGYKNIEEVDTYFKEKFKFTLADSRIESLRLSRLIQIRNVISHNRGVVNAVFLRKIGSKADKLGMNVILPNVHAVDIYLINFAQRIDARAVSKFDLPCLEREGDTDA